MGKDTTYNGYTNRETWLVSLWVDNDQGLYERRRELQQDAVDVAEGTDREARHVLRDYLPDFIEDECIPSDCFDGLVGDIVGSFLRRVDWTDLADTWCEEVSS